MRRVFIFVMLESSKFAMKPYIYLLQAAAVTFLIATAIAIATGKA